MRYLLLAIFSLTVYAADESPRVDPTRVDRVQGLVDPATGKIESLQVWDVQDAVDSIGNRIQVGERATTITRAQAPALFAALDALIAKTAERDAGHKDRKRDKDK